MNTSRYRKVDTKERVCYDIKSMSETTEQSDQEYLNDLKGLNMRIRDISMMMRRSTLQPIDKSPDVTKRTQNFFNTSISRAITISIPMIPPETCLRDILVDITEHHMHNFLVRIGNSVELITSQNVFDYISNGNSIFDSAEGSIKRVRVPFVSRKMSIRKAFRLMTDRNLPLLLIDWTMEEQIRYSTEKGVFYPNVVTLSQIYSMMCQRYIEDGVTHDSEEETVEDDTENQSPVVRKSMNTAVGRASMRQSTNQEAGEATQNETSASITETSKLNTKELLKNLNEGLLILGQHYMYRGIFILFLMGDMLMTAINILGFYSYRLNIVYFIFSVLFLLDWLLRFVVIKGNHSLFKMIFDCLALILSFFCFFVYKTQSGFSEGLIKLILLLRLFRDYFVVDDYIPLFSLDIRRIFNRSRARQKEKNLDITYISSRIIAMSWPGSNWESVWRNNINDVEEFLNKRHMGHYWVLNLCEEGDYKSKKRALCFGGRYTHYCIQDHNPCSLNQLRSIIYECTEWLTQDPSNVVAIHCKGGKGRTGMVVASLLLRQGIQCEPSIALDFFAAKRTSSDNDGEENKVKIQRVSSPSQIRYVCYYDYLLDHILQYRPALHLVSLEIPIRAKQLKDAMKPVFTVSIIRNQFDYGVDTVTGRLNEGLFIQGPEDVKKSYCDLLAHQNLIENHITVINGQEMTIDSNRRIAVLTFNPPIELSGDVKIDIRQVNLASEHSSFVWFNTQFITDKLTVFNESEIDRSKSSSSSSSSYSYSSAYSYSDSTAYSVANTVDGSEAESVVVDMENTPPASLSVISSSRSIIPLIEDTGDREFFIRCEFGDKWLEETDSYQILHLEREMSKNRGEVPSDSEEGKNAFSIIQKAGSHILTSARTLVSRVSSSTSGGLLRSGSGPSSPILSRQSSRSDIEMNSISPPPIDISESKVAVETQLREKKDIELRMKMRLNSVHESEEFRKSVNTSTQNETAEIPKNPAVIEESSDEIQLDSDTSA